jgi:hypothetical protein
MMNAWDNCCNIRVLDGIPFKCNLYSIHFTPTHKLNTYLVLMFEGKAEPAFAAE